MSEVIIDKNVAEQYKHDYIVYAKEVNRRRSMADARDGLKLVHRRILHAMNKDLPCGSKAVKTAKVVGEVMGNYHPHGDSSIADAIKCMTNWWETKMPYIDTVSNMGSMQGDGAAAPRYTEVKLSQFSNECMLEEINSTKDIVDYVPNFDNTRLEPEYLTTKVPNLLINGTFGIGVGIKADIPPHNINEVIDATLAVIQDPSAPVVLVPDQCMPCEIIDTNWKSISNKGEGSYRVRGIIDIEHHGDVDWLIIKSVPDMVYFDKGNRQNGGVKYKILDMIKDGQLPQITKIDEDSHGNEMRICIHLKKGADPNYVREMLYKSTQLEESFSVNFQVLIGLDLVRMSYKSYIEFFIEQRKITKFRYYCNKLQEVRTKLHQKDAYIKVLESGEINKIISMIQNQRSIDDKATIEYLIKTLKITDFQAEFIINANIKQLSRAYLEKYKAEAAEYSRLNDEYMAKITNDNLILQEIVDELLYIKKKYGRPRCCKVISKSSAMDIPEGNFKVIVTDKNFIKKVLPTDFVGSVKGHNPAHVINVENTKNILLFTDIGKVYNIPVHQIPLSEKNGTGVDLSILTKGKIATGANIIKVLYLPTVEKLMKAPSKFFITVVTENNYIKKLDLDDFINVPPSGILYTKLNDRDLVKDVSIVSNNLDIIIYSDRKALRVNMSEIPHYNRNTIGVAAMNTTTPIDGLSIIYPDATDVVVVTKEGKINKFDISGLAKSSRNKAGSSVIKLGKNDTICSIVGVNDTNTLKIATKESKIDLPVSEIARGSSISPGSKLLQRSDQVIKVDVLLNK